MRSILILPALIAIAVTPACLDERTTAPTEVAAAFDGGTICGEQGDIWLESLGSGKYSISVYTRYGAPADAFGIVIDMPESRHLASYELLEPVGAWSHTYLVEHTSGEWGNYLWFTAGAIPGEDPIPPGGITVLATFVLTGNFGQPSIIILQDDFTGYRWCFSQ